MDAGDDKAGVGGTEDDRLGPFTVRSSAICFRTMRISFVMCCRRCWAVLAAEEVSLGENGYDREVRDSEDWTIGPGVSSTALL